MTIVNNKGPVAKYEEEQKGWFLSILLIIVAFFISLTYFSEWGNNPLPVASYAITMVVLSLVFLTFYKMKLVAEPQVIRIIFGIGLIGIKIEFDEITKVQVRQTSWYHGSGIRITGEGMLYNIHGSGAVKVSYVKAGVRNSVPIGTADPNSLRDFLLSRR